MLAPAPSPERLRRSLARTAAKRLSNDALIRRAEFLPFDDRALLLAYHLRGLPLDELASLHRTTPRQLRHRLDALRNTLADPSFLLAARFAKRLPANLPDLARGRWIEGIPLRVLAQQQRLTLHQLRQQLAHACSLMMFFAEAELKKHEH